MGHMRTLGVPILKGIVPAPAFRHEPKRTGDARGFQELRITSSLATMSRGWDNFHFIRAFCKEHRRHELVPNHNFHGDLSLWYRLGKHPRFSIIGALLSATPSPQYGEIITIVHSTAQHNRRLHQALVFALRRSKTPKQFIKLLVPYLFVTLYHQRRRYRVEQRFKQKFLSQSFTTDEFFAERNQERRRLMLRRGVNLAEVLSRLVLLKEDSEGKLYAEKGQETNGSLYLYVVCPSTKQEYLLTVPRGEMRTVPLPEEKWVKTSRWEPYELLDESLWTKTERVFHEFAPAEARRWTFSLPDNAVFTEEA